MTPELEALLARLDSYRRNERHNNLAETMHWFRQYKLLAEDAAAAIRSLAAQLEAYEEAQADKRRLTRELDVIWNGEAGAAKQASLCDIVSQLASEVPAERKAREEAEQPELDHMVTRFLKWPLPPSVCSDLCATDYGKEGRCGTNLLNAEEAKNMLRYVLRGRAFAYGMLKMEADGLRQRATAAEARLAQVERETIERCAKVCNEHPGNLVSNNWSSVGALRDCVRAIRAIAKESAAPSGGQDAP